MKKILTAILLICGFVGEAQYNPSIHFPVVSDAIGVSQATPTDARSMFFNTSTFAYRNYSSRAEANTYLNLAKYRSGRFSIYIDSSGHTYEYYYRDCTSDTCLVLKSTSAVNMDSVLFAPNYRVDTAKVNLRNSIAGKISTTLNSGQILVGNVSNVATAVTPSNDVSITPGGSFTVNNQWKLVGNTGTTDLTNFIGTTNSVPLTFKVNNFIAGRIDHNNANAFFGYRAGGLTSSSNNTALGSAALLSNTSGSGNVAVGTQSLFNSGVGNQNTGIGYNALTNNTTGGNNTVIGANSGGGLSTGNYNTILGANVTGLGAALNNNIIIADGQGNQRIKVDSFGTATVVSTTALGFPSGNTAQRPSSPIAGYTRYNTDSLKLEFYNGSIWGALVNGSAGSGITLLNGLSATTQLFAVGTSGSTPNISSVSNTHTFNFPLSGTHSRGILDSTDWITFNGKLSNITGLVTAGTNIAVTGSGTSGSPYVVTATAGSGINQLTGDVTAGPGIGSQAATIAASAVTTTKINNNAVTYAKMQAMTANKLLGSGASGTAVAEITLGTGLSFSGTTLNASATGSGIANLDSVLATGGRLHTTYTTSIGNNLWTMDSAAFRYNLISNGLLNQIYMPNISGVAPAIMRQIHPSFYADTNYVTWKEKINGSDNGDGTHDNAYLHGWNINGDDNIHKMGTWRSDETNFTTGHWVEDHLQSWFYPGFGEIRGLSCYFKPQWDVSDPHTGIRTLVDYASIGWEMRGTDVSFISPADTSYFNASRGFVGISNGRGTGSQLSLLNGTSDNFLITNAGGAVSMSGMPVNVVGNLALSTSIINSTDRAGMRFIGNGGSGVAYIIQHGTAYADPTLANTATFIGTLGYTGGFQIDESDHTVMGDLTAYTRTTEKIQLAGITRTRSNIIVDSSIYTPNITTKTLDTTNFKLIVANSAGQHFKMNWPVGGGGGTGLANLNGQIGSTQTFAVGSSGTNFNISSVSNVHTFNIPLASIVDTGLVTIGSQDFLGTKNFNGNLALQTSAFDNTGRAALSLWGNPTTDRAFLITHGSFYSDAALAGQTVLTGMGIGAGIMDGALMISQDAKIFLGNHNFYSHTTDRITLAGVTSVLDTLRLPNVILKPLDTTNYKILVEGTAGNVFAMNWPTNGGGSGNTNANVGSAYRWAIPNTNNIKTFSAGYGTILDSATTNQLGIKLDSATVYTYVRSLLGGADTLHVLNRGVGLLAGNTNGSDSLFLNKLNGLNSIVGSKGSDSSNNFQLVNDTAIGTAASYYYGTNSTGRRGYYAIPTAANIYNSDGSLSGDRTLSGASHHLFLGNGASKLSDMTINSAGLLQLFGGIQYSTTNTTDANFTQRAFDYYIQCDAITANRTLTLLTSVGSGATIEIINVNASVNTWSFSPAIKDAAGNTIANLVNGTVYRIYYNGTNWIKLNN